MKKIVFILILLAGALSLISCGDIEKEDAEAYWFPSDMEVQRVNVETSISGEVPGEMGLLVTHVASYPDGNLYELRLDYNEEFTCRSYDGCDRRHLGYFYVEEDSVYRVRVIDEGFKASFDTSDTADGTAVITQNDDITTWSEQDLKSKGTIVCSNRDIDDRIEKEEQGFHEVIETDGNCSMYQSWYNRVETDFYERFTWERGKGLVYYESGYGAASFNLEITLAER